MILRADGHSPTYKELPCKLLLAAFELKFTTAIFFFFFIFTAPWGPSPFTVVRKMWELWTLCLRHEQSLALTGHLRGCFIPGSWGNVALAPVGEKWKSCGIWTWWQVGSLPWTPTPAPPLSAAAEHCSLPSALWLEAWLLGWLCESYV